MDLGTEPRMRIKLDLAPDLIAAMAAEIKVGEKGRLNRHARAGIGLKTAWRAQITNAGLGRRLANSIRSQTYPKSGDSLSAAALVWSQAPVILRAHDTGPLIRSKNGFGWRSQQRLRASQPVVAGSLRVNGNASKG